MIGTLRAVALDAPDARRLAAFYAALAGWAEQYADDEWITLETGDGWRIAAQLSPEHVPPAKDPSAATNPLESTYGKWEAVENSSLAIVETASLLTVPGRLCSNGRPVPATNPDWPKLVQGLRDAGMKSYVAAQSKNQDKLTDATDELTTACSNCHVKYRDKDKLEDRCR